MPYPAEHACRIHDPKQYDHIRRKNGDRTHEGKKYDVIYGIKKNGDVEDQAYRYPKGTWSAAEARKHCTAHKGIEFEAAGKALDPNARYERFVEIGKLTAGKASDGNGWIEGYANVFDVIDSSDEIVRHGAFAKSIRERVPAGKVKLMIRHLAHGGGALEVIGTVTEAVEDAKGLKIHADLAGTDAAQETRQLILEGHLWGLSIGYQPVQWGYVDIDTKEILELSEVKLFDVTVTGAPVNEESVITAAKAVDSLAAALKGNASTGDGRMLAAIKQSRFNAALASIRTLEAELGRLQVEAGKSEPQDGPDMLLYSWQNRLRAKRLRLMQLLA